MASGEGKYMETRHDMANTSVISNSVPMRSAEEDKAAGATSTPLTSARDAIVAGVVISGGSLLFTSSLLYAALLSRFE